MRIVFIGFSLTLFGCATVDISDRGSKIRYVSRWEIAEANGCQLVAQFKGHAGDPWGGSHGKDNSRNDIMNQASEKSEINLLVETGSSWFTGSVTASGYHCDGNAANHAKS